MVADQNLNCLMLSGNSELYFLSTLRSARGLSSLNVEIAN